jgi:uncharacterized repeat protein (TIGR03806 family)
MRAYSSWSLASLTLGVALAGSSLAAACGDDDVTGVDTTDGGGDGTVADGDVPPIDSPFGLDARPANPTCKAPGRPPNTTAVKWTEVFGGLGWQQPMRMLQIPGDNSRMFVAQRNGLVVSFASNATAGPVTTVFDLNAGKAGAELLNEGGEGGLLGMAFHPGFAQNGFAYLSYTKNGGATGMRSVVTRIKSTDNGATFGQESVVITPFDQPATNHNGGNIGFGRDGFLYIGFGDGGGGGDTYKHGQETTSFFSKILRINVDVGSPYSTPDDNPFKISGGAPEVYAYGFRNPFRWSHDKDTGELWVGDVGQNAWEEIDKVKLGGNYGWSKKEGTHCYNAGAGFPAPGVAPCPVPGVIDPVFDYDHVQDGINKSITGGYVYRGKAIPSFVGTYIYGDYVIGKIWALTDDPGTGKPAPTQINAGGPSGGWSSFAEDNDGELYALDLSGNKIYKMVANPVTPGDAGVEGGSTAAPPADKLSLTGCVDPTDPKRPAGGLIGFTVNSPLWSDGAEKERFMALPDGAKIKVGTDGDWDLPIGTVLVKTFKLGGKRIETRLFVRHEDGGWGGFSYEWNDQETDATLLPSSKTRQVGAQAWYYPSRADCGSCHSGAAGRSLGLEDGQLNGLFVYSATNRRSNQIATLEHIGLFETPHPGPEATGKYPTPTVPADGTVEARARSYMHANCSFCHRPQGIGGGSMDFRFATATGDINACDANPATGDLGVAGLKVLKPGDPAKSAISVRTHALDAKRMPPLASSVVDKDGVAVIDEFITSLTTCPATTIKDAGGQ